MAIQIMIITFFFVIPLGLSIWLAVDQIKEYDKSLNKYK
jgi:hypothetical protein